MRQRLLGITISAAALLIAILHLLFPAIVLDVATLTLLGIAVLPWLGLLFKSVQLPGGLKIEYRDLQQAKKEAADAGLLRPPSEKKREPAYLAIAQEDPNLALAGLRIEIERRLRGLAEKRGITTGRGLGTLLHRLRDENVLSPQQHAVLSDLVGLLNEAVHGAEVSQQAAQWAIDVGPQLLAALDERADF